jgi:tmRNA-binding protein
VLLKFHASKCGYGGHYNYAVHDQFVFGLTCKDTHLKLMEMDKLTLKDAFAFAEA